MAKKIGKRTVTVKRQAKVDRLSTDIPAVTTHDIEDCAILPQRSFDTEKGWITLDAISVWAPWGSDVTENDTIIIQSEPFAGTYDVNGKPAPWENRRGDGKAVEISLVRVI